MQGTRLLWTAMTVRTVIRMGHPVLRRVAEPVARFDTPELHALVEDLWDTMHASGGIGIAAPQIAVAARVVVFGLGEGAEIRGPMAITVIGGLLVSTLLTLVVIPTAYSVFDRKRFAE